jgi:hypothetical protein
MKCNCVCVCVCVRISTRVIIVCKYNSAFGYSEIRVMVDAPPLGGSQRDRMRMSAHVIVCAREYMRVRVCVSVSVYVSVRMYARVC